MSRQSADPTHLGDLGDGLACRWSTKAAQERIGYLMGSVFRRSRAEPVNLRTADEARVFMNDDFADTEPFRQISLQLLFGYRSLSELRAIFPDVWASEDAALLLDILFPKQPSTAYSLSYT